MGLRLARAAIVAAGLVTAIAITRSSLDPDQYFRYQTQPPPAWTHPTGEVVVFVLFTLAETAAVYLVFGLRLPWRVWSRACAVLIVLVPWGLLMAILAMHGPGFYFLHFLWVWLLILTLVTAALASGIRHAAQALARSQT